MKMENFRQYSLRIWPNGEFGIGQVEKFRPKPRLEGSDPKTPMSYSWTKSECMAFLGVMLQRGYGLKYVLGLLSDAQQESLRYADALGLSIASNSHSRKSRGSRGLSTYAKRMLRNGCELLEQRVGKRNVAMVTTTLPTCDEDLQKKISHEWPEIVRVFCQRVHRYLERAGGNPWVIGCIEIQEKRMEEYGGLPLHLHIVFQARKKGGWVIRKDELPGMWRSAMVSRVPELEDADFSASTRIELVRKTVSGYLCKYLTKGVNQSVLVKESEGYRIPTSWWIGFGNFKKTIKKLIICDTSELASRFVSAVHSYPGVFIHIGRVCIGEDPWQTVVGWYGRIPDFLVKAISEQREHALPDMY